MSILQRNDIQRECLGNAKHVVGVVSPNKTQAYLIISGNQALLGLRKCADTGRFKVKSLRKRIV